MKNNEYPRGVIVPSNRTEDAVYFKESDLVEFELEIPCPKELEGEEIFDVRSGGAFGGKGIWLNTEYNWQIVKDSEGYLVLVATKK